MKPEMTSEEEAFERTKNFKADCLLFGSSDTDKDKDFKAIVDDNYFYKRMISKTCHLMGLDINPFEDLEETENAMINYINENECFRVEVATNKKKLKAFEILKEKRVNLEYIKCCENYGQYCLICSYGNEITEEEFYLLKEVLL